MLRLPAATPCTTLGAFKGTRDNSFSHTFSAVCAALSGRLAGVMAGIMPSGFVMRILLILRLHENTRQGRMPRSSRLVRVSEIPIPPGAENEAEPAHPRPHGPLEIQHGVPIPVD